MLIALKFRNRTEWRSSCRNKRTMPCGFSSIWGSPFSSVCHLRRIVELDESEHYHAGKKKMCPIYQHLSPTGQQGRLRMEDFLSREKVRSSPESISPEGDLATRHRWEVVMTVVADSGFFFLGEKKKKRGKGEFAEHEF